MQLKMWMNLIVTVSQQQSLIGHNHHIVVILVYHSKCVHQFTFASIFCCKRSTESKGTSWYGLEKYTSSYGKNECWVPIGRKWTETTAPYGYFNSCNVCVWMIGSIGSPKWVQGKTSLGTLKFVLENINRIFHFYNSSSSYSNDTVGSITVYM